MKQRSTVREVSVLARAERPHSPAQQAVIDALAAYGWGLGGAAPA